MVQTEIPSQTRAATQSAPRAGTPAREMETDDLIELELRVARRADELARSAGTNTALNLRHWLQAEQEILQPLMDQDRSSRRYQSSLAAS